MMTMNETKILDNIRNILAEEQDLGWFRDRDPYCAGFDAGYQSLHDKIIKELDKLPLKTGSGKAPKDIESIKYRCLEQIIRTSLKTNYGRHYIPTGERDFISAILNLSGVTATLEQIEIEISILRSTVLFLNMKPISTEEYVSHMTDLLNRSLENR